MGTCLCMPGCLHSKFPICILQRLPANKPTPPSRGVGGVGKTGRAQRGQDRTVVSSTMNTRLLFKTQDCSLRQCFETIQHHWMKISSVERDDQRLTRVQPSRFSRERGAVSSSARRFRPAMHAARCLDLSPSGSLALAMAWR